MSSRRTSVARYNFVTLVKYPLHEFFGRRLSRASSEWTQRLLWLSSPDNMAFHDLWMHVDYTQGAVFEIRALWLYDSLRNDFNKEKYGINKRELKTYQRKLNVQQFNMNKQNMQEILLTRSVRQLWIQRLIYFYTKLSQKKNRLNELTKIHYNDYVTRRRE